MSEPIPGALGETAAAYKTQSFTTGMANLAQLFQSHPELKGLQATVDSAGHVDIVAAAERGVLHDWVRAIPTATRERGLYTIHSGLAYEEILRDGSLTVHVRPVGA